MATQTMAEHRMYLPLAAVVSLAVCGSYAGYLAVIHSGLRRETEDKPTRTQRWGKRTVTIASATLYVAEGLVVAAAITLGSITHYRNDDYRSAMAIWRDTVDKVPRNARARDNLGKAFSDEAATRLGTDGARLVEKAMEEFQAALEFKPDDAVACSNIGLILGRQGRLSEAVEQLRRALAMKSRQAAALNRTDIDPEMADIQFKLAVALETIGQPHEAIAYYREAIKLKPPAPMPLNNLAWLLATSPNAALRNGDEAVVLAKQAVELGGAEWRLLDTLAAAYAEAGRFPEAAETAQEALELASRQQSPSLIDGLRAQIALYGAENLITNPHTSRAETALLTTRARVRRSFPGQPRRWPSLSRRASQRHRTASRPGKRMGAVGKTTRLPAGQRRLRLFRHVLQQLSAPAL